MRECYKSGGGGHRAPLNLVKTENCAEDGLICSEETGRARCVFEETRCVDEPEPRVLCVGNVVATCDNGAAHPAPALDCSKQSEEPYCVEGDEGARCSPFEESCPEDGAELCMSDIIIYCNAGVWVHTGPLCQEEMSPMSGAAAA